MIGGVLLRLGLCVLFAVVAWYALRPDNFSEMLENVSEHLGRPRNALDGWNEFQNLLQKAFYGLAILCFLFAGTHLYHQLRTLPGKEDPLNKTTMPYSGRDAGAPGAPPPGGGQPAGGGQPYGGGGATAPAGSGTAAPAGGQPAGGAQPYSGGGGTAAPAGGAQPYSGR